MLRKQIKPLTESGATRPSRKKTQMKNPATDRRGTSVAQHFKPRPPILVFGLAGLISLAAVPSISLAADHAYKYEVVATVGSAAPGGGAFVSDFEPTALNNHGQIIFTAEPDEPGEEGVFL